MTHTQDFMRTASRRLHDAPRHVQDMASSVTDRLQDLGSNAGEMASDYYDRGRVALRRSASNLQDVIEDQPIRSTLVALGLGCLLCAFLIRR